MSGSLSALKRTCTLEFKTPFHKIREKDKHFISESDSPSPSSHKLRGTGMENNSKSTDKLKNKNTHQSKDKVGKKHRSIKIAVKVIDIFGNDTMRTKEIKL